MSLDILRLVQWRIQDFPEGRNSRGAVPTYHYRPQTKFAKVMFSQVFWLISTNGDGFEFGSLGQRSVPKMGTVIIQETIHTGIRIRTSGKSCGSLSKGSLSGRPPLRLRAGVHILLECILILQNKHERIWTGGRHWRSPWIHRCRNLLVFQHIPLWINWAHVFTSYDLRYNWCV